MKYIKIFFISLWKFIKQAQEFNKSMKLLTKGLPKQQKLIIESHTELPGNKVQVIFKRYKSFKELYQMGEKLYEN